MPITQVQSLIDRLILEEKIERQIGSLGLNHPIIQRGIKIDARVDEMQSDNPGITRKEIAKRLNLPIHRVQSSLQRLKVYRQIEQLMQQEKTVLQIAQEMGVGEGKAKFDIARLHKLRGLQRNFQNQQPSTSYSSTDL